MTTKHRICIAEDHTILRAGLRALLDSDLTMEVVGEASNGLELLDMLHKCSPDLVIMDLSMPALRGLEAISEIRQRHPHVKILVLTMHDSEEFIFAALNNGAKGYALKESSPNELVMAINTVLAGKVYLSPEISGKVLNGYLEGKKTEKPSSAWDSLTHREREILKLIAERHKNKEIAEYLHMSVKTVETHRSNLMKKLDLHSAAALTAYAMEKGLVTK